MKKNDGLVVCIQTASIFLFACLLISCGSSKRINTNYLYFRDGADTVLTQQKETVIQPNDLLNIQVFSRTLNQEQAAIFNIAAATGNNNTGNSNLQGLGYQVSTDGNIAMPVIGNIKAAGLTKEQLQNSLVTKLTDYVKNPIIVVHFLQFTVNILGEVKSPGTHRFITDRVTIIDAIGAAGDLTDFGRREDVKVIREENGKRITHIIDLRTKDIFRSSVYVLQPNDIVYVEPTKIKLKSLNIDPDTQRENGVIFFHHFNYSQYCNNHSFGRAELTIFNKDYVNKRKGII